MSTAPPLATIPTLGELPLEIVTARLHLRQLRASDAEAYFPHVRDPELPRLMSWTPHTSIEETRTWLHGAIASFDAGTDVVWAIEHAGYPIGCVGLHGIRWSLRALRTDRAELGYWVARAHWNRGYMSEAAGAVTRWAFETLGLHKVVVQCFEANAASKRVIEKLGFRFVGRAEEDVWRDGTWHAHLRYELVKTEWQRSAVT